MKRISLIILCFGMLSNAFCLDFSSSSQLDGLLYSVSITGAVPKPGVYHVPPTARLSELYQLALAKSVQAPSNEIVSFPNNHPDSLFASPLQNIRPSLRNLTLIRNKERIQIDLATFFHRGDISQNPFLKDGDIVHVGAFTDYVTIEGEVHQPAQYELLANTTLKEIIDFAYDFTLEADKKSIFVYRNQASGNQLKLHKIDYTTKADHFLLQNQDRIVVPAVSNSSKKREHVYLYGEVAYPGKYPYEPVQHSLLELLELAGGPLPSSNLEYAFIQRNDSPLIHDGEHERLLNKPFSEMTQIEKEYLKSLSRYPINRIQVDIKKLWQTKDKEHDIKLEANDLIFIPDEIPTVTVNGSVKIPGRFFHLPEKNMDYYIQKAGGFSWNVDKRKIRLIRYQTKEWVKPNEETIIYPGDMIFIPEKKDYDYWEITKEVLSVGVQFTTLIVLINNLSTK